MSKYIISESNLKKLIMEEVKNIVTKRRLINVIYKVTKQITGHLYHDEHWQGVDDIRNALADLNMNVDIYSVNGGYKQNSAGDALWKEYQVEIEYDGVIVKGILNCHAAGSVEYPFDRYDMSLQLW